MEIPRRTLVEFRVEDYRESNTRFLLMNDNRSGLVLDSSDSKIPRIVTAGYFWRHDSSQRIAGLRANLRHTGIVADRRPRGLRRDYTDGAGRR